MAETKTKPTTASVKDFLAGVASEQQRKDAGQVLQMMQEITGLKPTMWGPSMVGFGNFHYVYDSGHEGDCFITGFSPRKDALTLYFSTGFTDHLAADLKKLGKVKTGKCCLYVKKLADVDQDVLRSMIQKNFDKVSTMTPDDTRRASISQGKPAKPKATKKAPVKKAAKKVVIKGRK